MRVSKIIFCCLFLGCGMLNAQTDGYLHSGHAHNDYQHKRPLFDALENEFNSIEVDVYLHKGKLVVSHLPMGLDKKPNLETLYLRPLDSIVKANNGFVLKNGYNGDSATIILMIDFKTSGNEAYIVLKELLNKYKHLFTSYNKSTIVKHAPIQVLISGATPNVWLLGDTSFVTLDKGFSVLNDSTVLPYVTRISEPWGKYFCCKTKLSKKDLVHLKDLVTQAHKAGKQLRFWTIPNNKNIPITLKRNGVDWINIDKLKKYSSQFGWVGTL